MISISLVKQSAYPISAKKVKEAIVKVLTDQGMVSDSEVSVALVGRNKMADYVKDYYKGDDEYDHPVLSFPNSETKERFILPPDGKIHLGEIVVSYDECVNRARSENRLVEDVVIEMAEHGALHLIGVHHG